MATWQPRGQTDGFDDVVEAALAEIPEAFRPYLENVIIEVQRRPDRSIAPPFAVCCACDRPGV